MKKKLLCKSFTKKEIFAFVREYSDSNLKRINRYAWSELKKRLLECEKVEINLSDHWITFLDGNGCYTSTLYDFADELLPFYDFIAMKYDNKTTSTTDCVSTSINSTSTSNAYSSTISNGDIYYTTTTTPSLNNYAIHYPELNDNNNKENKKMNGINFDFGKVTSDNVRLSLYGIAVKSVNGNYVSYDPKSHSIMDVEIINIPVNGMLYKMPVAIKDIKAGDVVIHNKVPMFVVEVHESTIKVIDIREGAEKEIYLTKNIFNFNFATKIVSLLDMSNTGASADNPFGNMLPFLMMSDDSKDIDPMMFMLMSGGKFDMSNPMMMYFMMKDGNKSDMLPFMLMAMNGNNKSNG